MRMDDTLDVDELVSQHLAVGSETNLSALSSAADQLERRTENVRSQGTPSGFADRCGECAAIRVASVDTRRTCIRPVRKRCAHAVVTRWEGSRTEGWCEGSPQVKRELYRAVRDFYGAEPATGSHHGPSSCPANRRDHRPQATSPPHPVGVFVLCRSVGCIPAVAQHREPSVCLFAC